MRIRRKFPNYGYAIGKTKNCATLAPQGLQRIPASDLRSIASENQQFCPCGFVKPRLTSEVSIQVDKYIPAGILLSTAPLRRAPDKDNTMQIDLIRKNVLDARLLCDGGMSISKDEECDRSSLGAQFEQVRRLLEEISESL
jgi:hypothetical protein